MSRFIDWLKDFFCNIPDFEITPERETELIEDLVEKITKYDLESTSTVLSHMVLVPLTPYLEAFGINGDDYVALFSNKENVKRLMKRLDEVKLSKEFARETTRHQENESKMD
jgi:hypothetical protein